MRLFYAIVDSDNVCTGVIDTYKTIVDSKYIPCETLDYSLMGMRWNGKEWKVVEVD